LALVNAATLQTGPVAPGSLISIFGSNLAPAAISRTVPKPAELTVSINGISCPLLFVSWSQINAQLPFEVPAGPATAVLQLPNMPPAAIALTVAPAAPGIFTDGQNHPAIQNAGGASNTAANPVQAGSLISVLLTGQGPVAPPVATGSAAPARPLARTVYPVVAVFGRHVAEITSAELLPGSIGLFQVTLRLPAMRTGAYRFMIKVNGISSNAAIINVAGSRPATSAAWKRN
jgi:uncharacterized protein (TIGR03437 family)